MSGLNKITNVSNIASTLQTKVPLSFYISTVIICVIILEIVAPIIIVYDLE